MHSQERQLWPALRVWSSSVDILRLSLSFFFLSISLVDRVRHKWFFFCGLRSMLGPGPSLVRGMLLAWWVVVDVALSSADSG
jgi:hypothetical protein